MNPMKPTVQIKVLDKDLYETGIPGYATPGSAAVDLKSKQTISIAPNQSVLVGTGVAIWLKEPAYVGLVFPRSGLGSRGLVLGNLTGVIDSDYQGEIKVSLWNRTNEYIEVSRGDRVAQYLITPVVRANFDVVDEFDGNSERASGGFGSTGK